MELHLTAQREGKLSSFLRHDLKLSATLVNRLKWKEAFLVNGIPQHTNFPVKSGDVITVRLDEEAPEYPAQAGNLSILYEDEWLLAVDKPSGMLIHPSRAKNEGTLANFVAGYYQKTGQCAAFHPLTRLDRDTFGVVLVAKNAHIHALLQEAHPQKTYEALVYGTPPQPEGEVTAPIARCEMPSLLRRIDPEGKPCRTLYRVLESGEHFSRLELHPITGAPISCGCTAPTWGAPFWATLSTAARRAWPFLKPWGFPPSFCAQRKSHFPTPSPAKTSPSRLNWMSICNYAILWREAPLGRLVGDPY